MNPYETYEPRPLIAIATAMIALQTERAHLQKRYEETIGDPQIPLAEAKGIRSTFEQVQSQITRLLNILLIQ